MSRRTSQALIRRSAHGARMADHHCVVLIGLRTAADRMTTIGHQRPNPWTGLTGRCGTSVRICAAAIEVPDRSTRQAATTQPGCAHRAAEDTASVSTPIAWGIAGAMAYPSAIMSLLPAAKLRVERRPGLLAVATSQTAANRRAGQWRREQQARPPGQTGQQIARLPRWPAARPQPAISACEETTGSP